MKSADIRDAFLRFFADKDHSVVPSSSLIPGNDPTLLFTNAGMVQFKDVFLGAEVRPYRRAASSQRCVRAGGKHNDLENVGYTARHHTFFEMLGNFSFGDYFKREAIGYAWEFLTEVLALPPERLWVTVHVSDDEAADIWLKELGVSPERFSRLDEDNFWQMGDTGPCGPSSEIFYDHGPDVPGGPPGSPGDDLDRYIEIWNLVFMQYERSTDGTMTPLPRPSIDTGMGLERIAAVMQGVHTNYDIDLFQALITAASEVTGCADREQKSLRVIADHIRSAAFLIADGVLPSNEGRGYVLRRIVRRALRHGHKLGATDLFFHRLVAPLTQQMGAAYPELVEKQAQLEKVLRAEEEQFARTLDKGMALLDEALKAVEGEQISGELVFQLYDTYGFPVDLTNDIARERGFSLDHEGYERCMAEQKERARAAGQFKVDYTAAVQLEGTTEFTGYEGYTGSGRILALLRDGGAVDAVSAEQDVVVVLDRTPFYAESGGQVGDSGFLTSVDGARIEVRDCRKQGAHHLHIGRVLGGTLKLGDEVQAEVNGEVRAAVARNHSATHLLHAALRQVLGEHVAQQGSLVDSQRLRFDFTHFEAVSAGQLRAIERLINRQILANSEVCTELMSMEVAREKGAVALFGEKYGDTVRVLSMGGDFSVELCGGTHVRRTGDIGMLRVLSESGIASGVRRIEATSGENVLDLMDNLSHQIDQLAASLKTSPANLVDKTTQLVEQQKTLQRDNETLKAKLAASASGDLIEQARSINGITVLASVVNGADGKSLRNLLDQFRSRVEQGVFLLAAVEDDKVNLVAGVTKPVTDRIKAGELMQLVAPMVGGKGGGRPDMAQGGGSDSAAVPAALEAAYRFIEERLGA